MPLARNRTVGEAASRAALLGRLALRLRQREHGSTRAVWPWSDDRDGNGRHRGEVSLARSEQRR
jgi:hypothetical protein